MRLLTWNIQGGGGDRLPLILDHIERLRADVVALSEVTHANLGDLQKFLRGQGLTHIETTCRPGGPRCVLIASKRPLQVSDDRVDHDPERWLAVELKNLDLKLLCVHVPSARDNKFGKDDIGLRGKRRKELFWDQLIHYAQRHKDERVIMLGDFNTGLPEDAQGTPFVLSDRIMILRLEKYVDTWRHHNPRAKEYTYFSKHGSKKHGNSKDYNGFRLDYIFVSNALRESIVKSDHVHSVRAGNISDHSIVVADLAIGDGLESTLSAATAADEAADSYTPDPPEYVEGWGDLIRAHRKYLGVSQRCMAERLNMSERSLSDIEGGRRDCPPGLLDSIQTLMDEFDSAVAKAIQAARGAAAQSPGGGRVAVEISDQSDGGWDHAVLCRAAVKSGLLLPVRPSGRRNAWRTRALREN